MQRWCYTLCSMTCNVDAIRFAPYMQRWCYTLCSIHAMLMLYALLHDMQRWCTRVNAHIKSVSLWSNAFSCILLISPRLYLSSSKWSIKLSEFMWLLLALSKHKVREKYAVSLHIVKRSRVYIYIYIYIYNLRSRLIRKQNSYYVRFEVFTAVTMKNVVFWDIRTKFVLHRRHITSPLQSTAS
jgi:hypothetical protein